MNLRNPRGFENRLLRRVRRHQSMTALFRKPVSNPERQVRSWTPDIVQAQMQTSPVDAQESNVIPAPTAFIVPSAEVKQDSHPSEPVLQSSNVEPIRSVSASAPTVVSRKQATKDPDPDWKRLQTIFLKHQEQKALGTNETPDHEPPLRSELLSLDGEEQRSPSNADEQRPSAQDQPMPSLPKTAVQRLPQTQPNKSEPGNDIASTKITEKAQPLPPVDREPEATIKATDQPGSQDSHPAQVEEITDSTSTSLGPDQPPLQMQSAWDVQRLNIPPSHHHDQFDMTVVGSHNSEPSEQSPQNILSSNQQTNFKSEQPASMKEDNLRAEPEEFATYSPIASASEWTSPVEILAPSRPRPAIASNQPTGANIQRQHQVSETLERPEETSVNTAIGPLPADLWRLLGQEPPAETPVLKTNTETSWQEAPPDSNNVTQPGPLAEIPLKAPSSLSPTVQRQTVTDSSSTLTPSHLAQSSSAHREKNKHAEPDLDDLARRVYAEVRRRLASEWERMH